MKRSLMLVLVASISLAVAVFALTASAQTPTPAPKGEPDKICLPEQMAIVKESMGRARSDEQAALRSARATVVSAKAGAARYWERVSQAWLSEQTGAVPTAAAAQKTISETVPKTVPQVSKPAEPEDGPPMSAVCRALAARDADRCESYGKPASLFCGVITAVNSDGTCNSKSPFAGACGYLRGGTRADCDAGGHPAVCDAIALSRNPETVRQCSTSKTKSYPCLVLGLFHAISKRSANACKELGASQDAVWCRAIVRSRPKECSKLAAVAKGTTEGKTARARFQARLIGSFSGAPKVLVYGTASRPQLCHLKLTAPSAPKRIVWEGTARVPSFRSPSTVLELEPTAEAARNLDPLTASELTATWQCMDRYYW